MKILIVLMLLSTYANADIRCCQEPKRYNDGRLVRSASVIAEFQRLYPLPPELNRKDYQINHAVPLVCGGKDIIENLVWMHISAKICAQDYCQDRHEQKTMCPKSYHK